PTPSPPPAPEDVALFNGRHNQDENGTDATKRKPTSLLDGSTESERTSEGSRPIAVNEEAVLSDTSESRLPPPIKRPGDGKRRSSVTDHERMLKLSPKQIHDLTSEPASIPIRAASPIPEHAGEDGSQELELGKTNGVGILEPPFEPRVAHEPNGRKRSETAPKTPSKPEKDGPTAKPAKGEPRSGRPTTSSRTMSTPAVLRRNTSSQKVHSRVGAVDGEGKALNHANAPVSLDPREHTARSVARPSAPSAQDKDRNKGREPSPMSRTLPLPPFSLPTFLSLELAAERPSPLYLYRPSNTEFPYESSKIKYDRLVNFLLLPPKLECILGFGAFACLDAWMHILTILPLRFLIAVWILVRWWVSAVLKEFKDLGSFVYAGLGRVWRRRKGSPNSLPATPIVGTPAEEFPPSRTRRPSTSGALNVSTIAREKGGSNTACDGRERRSRPRYRHRRTKSTPSALLPSHKADLLKGLLVVASCAILMRFDASKMYHGIRGQAAIKLYVIYNVLEVCDRLLSAVGQDVLECLFSRETLDRNPDGRSKVLRPFWMFLLALVYNVGHATALFYQVITLNVAVNSYSNALLTLLLSNQFVEIKGTVFKKFEKENLFQLTCADVVERFQLWLMLLIIAMRNIVEVGGLSIRSSDSLSWRSAFGLGNPAVPFTASSIIPRSFTIFPKWIAQVLNPFLLVLGSEMLVDWLKHAYITKFNQVKPAIYDKFWDVLAKDYYSNAFADPNLTRRLGLPVLPLSCLFIRAAVQTYHMFIATHMPPPLPSTATSLTAESATSSSPATTAALARIDQIFRHALGRSTFGAPPSGHTSWTAWLTWSFDDFIAFATMAIVFLVIYLFLLAFKILLGMALLRIARNRYRGMKEREKLDTETGGKRIGGFGLVDVDEEKRRWIYNDDPDALKRLREKDESGKKKIEEEKTVGVSYERVMRYGMVAKRIW
ncbi:DUF747-domain-containing protein, partial [Sporormia fimetaria CBS 119925]